MADELIRQPLQNVGAQTSTNLNYGMQGAQMQQDAINSALSAGVSFLGTQEGKQRKENEAKANLQVMKGKAELKNNNKNYILALQNANTPEEIDKVRDEYTKNAEAILNNPKNTGIGRSKEELNNFYSVNKESMFTQPAIEQGLQLKRRNDFSNYETAVNDAIQDSNISNQSANQTIKDANDDMVEAGYITQQEANQATEKAIDDRNIYQATELTALTRNNIENIYRTHSQTAAEIATMNTDVKGGKKAQAEAYKDLQNKLKNEIKAQQKAHYDLIYNNEDLTQVQKQRLLSNVNNYASTYETLMRTTYDKIKSAKLDAQANDMNSLNMAYGNNPNKLWTPDELKRTYPNLSEKDISKFIDEQSDRQASKKRTADQIAKDTREDTKIMSELDGIFNAISLSGGVIDGERRMEISQKIGQIKNTTLKSQASELLDFTAPLNPAKAKDPRHKALNDYFTASNTVVKNKILDTDFGKDNYDWWGLGTADIEGLSEVEKMQLITNAKTESINMLKDPNISTEAVINHYNRAIVNLTTKETMQKARQRYGSNFRPGLAAKLSGMGKEQTQKEPEAEPYIDGKFETRKNQALSPYDVSMINQATLSEDRKNLVLENGETIPILREIDGIEYRFDIRNMRYVPNK